MHSVEGRGPRRKRVRLSLGDSEAGRDSRRRKSSRGMLSKEGFQPGKGLQVRRDVENEGVTLRLPGPLSPGLHVFPVCSSSPHPGVINLGRGNTCPWSAPGVLCRLHCFVLISFMIREKILGSCHQILAEPLMSLVYPERVSNSTLHIYAFLSFAIKV